MDYFIHWDKNHCTYGTQKNDNNNNCNNDAEESLIKKSINYSTTTEPNLLNKSSFER